METSELCRNIEINLDAFHDKELSAAEESEIEKHLAICPGCVDRLAQINRVVHSLRTMPKLTVSASLAEKLDAIAEKPSNVVAFRKSVLIPLSAAAAIALVFIGWKALTPSQLQQPELAQQQIQKRPVQAMPQPAQPQVASSEVSTGTVPQTSEQTQTVARPEQKPAPQLNSQKPEKAPVKAPKTMIAVNNVAPSAKITEDESTIAAAPSELSFNDAVGFSTDEDGLYDIKM